MVDSYRCPEEFLQFELLGRLSADAGYFRFGPKGICYGRTATGYRTPDASASLYNPLPDLHAKPSTVLLPFNPNEVVDNLRLERYARRAKLNQWTFGRRFLRGAYYQMRPWMDVGFRKYFQKLNVSGWRRVCFPRWPVDTSVEDLNEALLIASMRSKGVDRMPFIWFWPEGASSCVLMTHDVEGQRGYDFCRQLMDMDDDHKLKASIQLVPQGAYKVSEGLIEEIRSRGFEVNIQDLNHDGYLFAERQEFVRRAQTINRYGRDYGAKGFRAAVLYRNFDWYHALDFSYDMSAPNVAHLDPQGGGCCTVMPYFVGNILEIPLTTTQDYTLFHLLGSYSIDLWKTQVAAIQAKHGLISFLIHPDYILEDRARNIYGELLRWLRETPTLEQAWFALPGEVDQWWRLRSKMCLVRQNGGWGIRGAGAERARLAFATLSGDHIEYEIDVSCSSVGDCDSKLADTLS
jgi:hypothetical protein